MSRRPSPFLFINWAHWALKTPTDTRRLTCTRIHPQALTHSQTYTFLAFFSNYSSSNWRFCNLKTLACLDHDYHHKHSSDSELTMQLAVVREERAFPTDRHHIQKEVYESSQEGKSPKPAQLLGQTSSNYTPNDLLWFNYILMTLQSYAAHFRKTFCTGMIMCKQEEVTHWYLKDFLSVVQHLNPDGNLPSWRLARRTQARL